MASASARDLMRHDYIWPSQFRISLQNPGLPPEMHFGGPCSLFLLELSVFATWCKGLYPFWRIFRILRRTPPILSLRGELRNPGCSTFVDAVHPQPVVRDYRWVNFCADQVPRAAFCESASRAETGLVPDGWRSRPILLLWLFTVWVEPSFWIHFSLFNQKVAAATILLF